MSTSIPPSPSPLPSTRNSIRIYPKSRHELAAFLEKEKEKEREKEKDNINYPTHDTSVKDNKDNKEKDKENVKVTNVPVVRSENQFHHILSTKNFIPSKSNTMNSPTVTTPTTPSSSFPSPLPSFLLPSVSSPQYPIQILPHIPSTTALSVPHMYNSTLPEVIFNIRNDDIQYGIRPYYLLGKDNEKFVYLNPDNHSFYYRDIDMRNDTLGSEEKDKSVSVPLCTIWILIKNDSFFLTSHHNMGYVKRRVVEEGRKMGIKVLLLNPDRFDICVEQRGKDKDNKNTTSPPPTISYNGHSLPLPDCVIPRLGATIDYFSLSVLRQLSSLGILVLNTPEAMEISRDKYYTYQMLSAHRIPIPLSTLAPSPFTLNIVEDTKLSYPVIVKMASGSRGEAVWKVENEQEMEIIMGMKEIEAMKKRKWKRIVNVIMDVEEDGNINVVVEIIEKERRQEKEKGTVERKEEENKVDESLNTTNDDGTSSPPLTLTSQSPFSPSPDSPLSLSLSTSASSSSLDSLPSRSPSPTHSTSSLSSSASSSTTSTSASHLSSLSRLDRSRPIIIQQFISSCRGKDIRVLSIGGKIIASCMRKSSTSSFKSNYHQGGSVHNIELPLPFHDLVQKIFDITHLHFVGIDFLFDKDKFLVCELNSSPGFEGLERASEVNCAKEILKYAWSEIGKWREMNNKLYGTGEGGHKYNHIEKLMFPLSNEHQDMVKEAKKVWKVERDEWERLNKKMVETKIQVNEEGGANIFFNPL